MPAVTGTLRKILYPRDLSAPRENTFFIGIVHAPDSPFASPLGGEVKVKGNMLAPCVGMTYVLLGEERDDPRYGPAFCFAEYEAQYPTDLAAIREYLVENCRGVGPATAHLITDEFGEDTLAICKDRPEHVSDRIKGVTLDKAAAISRVLVENEENERIAIELKKILGGSRISKTAINAILQKYRRETVERIRENPYELTQIRGIGFHKADHVARNVGLSMSSPFRIECGISHVLSEAASGQGHTYLTKEMLTAQAVDLLTLEEAHINTMVVKMLQAGDLAEEPAGDISLYSYYEKERDIADRIRRMLARAAISTPTREFDFDGLAEDQIEAVKKAICHQVFALTGAPGTGKTTTVRKIISAFAGTSYALAAPTGKAAARLRELTGWEASTIHRLLKAQMHAGKFFFEYDQNNHLPYGLVVVDEASMIDVSLFHSLVIALRDNARLILVGDTNQLPPVGPGNVLRDLLAYGVPSVELQTIKRQNPGLIVTNCHRIKDGRPAVWTNTKSTDFFVAGMSDPSYIRDTILSLLTSRRLKDHFGDDLDLLRDVQVLSPVREKTELSCKALSLMLQSVMNAENKPENPDKEKIWLGDKVIQLRNNYDLDIVNGDVGYVYRVEPKKLWVRFDNPLREVALKKFRNDLDLGYALTVHKYQGSECPVVIIPIHRCFGPLILQRNWLYTAISRASRAVIIVGQAAEIERIIGRNKQVKRLTRLEGMLRNGT